MPAVASKVTYDDLTQTIELEIADPSRLGRALVTTKNYAGQVLEQFDYEVFDPKTGCHHKPEDMHWVGCTIADEFRCKCGKYFGG